MPDDPFSGIQDKDLASFCRDLVKRGYVVERRGTDHFQAYWKGEYTHCRIPLTPRSGQAFTRAKADIKRFERSHGLYVEPVKSERPKKVKTAPKKEKRIFVMPEFGDVNDRRPASIAPSQYTVATMLGVDAMMALASAVNPQMERPKEVTTIMTRSKNVRPQRERQSWTLEEKAAMVKRYRDAVLVHKGETVLKEMGIYNSHITSFTKQLKRDGWDPDAVPETGAVFAASEYVQTPEPVEIIHTMVTVAEPVFDPDEEITELTRQWSELVTRKRTLTGRSAELNTEIDDLLTKAEVLTVQRDQADAEATNVAASLTKVKKRLAEMVRED